MFRNYLKIVFRNLQRNKSYVAINVMGLALGIASVITIFSLVKYHLSFDNFHKDADRIYRFVTEKHRDNITYDRSTPPPLGKAFREDYTFAEKVARIATVEEVQITLPEENKKFLEESGVAFTESAFFDIFNFPLIQGNIQSALKEPNTAILTERMAEKYFSKVNPVGKTFLFNNKITFKITGVMRNLPVNSDRQTEIYVSYNSLKSFGGFLYEDSWGGISGEMQTFVKLRPNISVAQVEKVLPAYVKKYRPNSKNVHVYLLQPLKDVHFDARFDGVMQKRNLVVLGIIGLFLILTACVNFINLATAQALNRSKEVGVRKVLGSFRRQITVQFLAETGVITLIATTLGLVLANMLLPSVNQLFNTRITFHFLSDWQLIAFIPVLVVFVTILSGFYPALVLSGFQPIAALKGKLSQKTIGGFNTRRSLIVTQFVVAQILVIGMIVILNQMRYVKQTDLGFNKDAIIMLPTGSQDEKTRTLKQQIEALSGVEKVSVCAAAPAASGGWNTQLKVGSNPEEEVFRIMDKAGDENYLDVFGLEIIAGRNIFPADSVREFIVNEILAKKLNLASPTELLGKKITIGGNLTGPIVGVVKDFHNHSLHREMEPAFICVNPERRYNYAIKLKGADVSNTLAGIEKIWTKAYPEQVYRFEFLDTQIAQFYETEQTLLTLIQAFSIIAIFISCLGLYGLMSFMASQKTKEIGIRKVLGSTIGQIIWIFAKEFSRLILLSFLIAAPVAWFAMSKWLQDFNYHIEIGASVFLMAILGTFIVTFLTVSYQSFKAALMNPVRSLKSE